MLARALSMAIEMAFVGPLINCREESSIAPTVVITIAVYSPISAGIPKIFAYAMAWGTATAATVTPAKKSRRNIEVL
jgi:hypothetical protein